MATQGIKKQNNGFIGKIRDLLSGKKELETVELKPLQPVSRLVVKESYQLLYESMLELYPKDMASIKTVISFFRDMSLDYYSGNHEKFMRKLIDELLYAGLSNYLPSEEKRNYLKNELSVLKKNLNKLKTPTKPVIQDVGSISNILIKSGETINESEESTEE